VVRLPMPVQTCSMPRLRSGSAEKRCSRMPNCRAVLRSRPTSNRRAKVRFSSAPAQEGTRRRFGAVDSWKAGCHP
jgi:hypothetical protein